jgi:hypothetical protein
MAIGTGYVTALGTVVVSALAIGAAVGTHSLVRDTAVEAAATPGVTVAMSDDFCGAMREVETLAGAIEYPSPDLDAVGSGREAAALESLHAQGQGLLDSAEPLAALLTRAAELADEPKVAAALTAYADSTRSSFTETGQKALDATSIDRYVGDLLASLPGDAMNGPAPDVDPSVLLIDEYGREKCGFSIVKGGRAPDIATAKADATTLGTAMKAYYADWNPGDPPPVVTVENDAYYLLGQKVGEAPKYTRIPDQYAKGPTDWCISVAIVGSAIETYSFSSESGLSEGTCQARIPG